MRPGRTMVLLALALALALLCPSSSCELILEGGPTFRSTSEVYGFYPRRAYISKGAAGVLVPLRFPSLCSPVPAEGFEDLVQAASAPSPSPPSPSASPSNSSLLAVVLLDDTTYCTFSDILKGMKGLARFDALLIDTSNGTWNTSPFYERRPSERDHKEELFIPTAYVRRLNETTLFGLALQGPTLATLTYEYVLYDYTRYIVKSSVMLVIWSSLLCFCTYELFCLGRDGRIRDHVGITLPFQGYFLGAIICIFQILQESLAICDFRLDKMECWVGTFCMSYFTIALGLIFYSRALFSWISALQALDSRFLVFRRFLAPFIYLSALYLVISTALIPYVYSGLLSFSRAALLALVSFVVSILFLYYGIKILKALNAVNAMQKASRSKEDAPPDKNKQNALAILIVSCASVWLLSLLFTIMYYVVVFTAPVSNFNFGFEVLTSLMFFFSCLVLLITFAVNRRKHAGERLKRAATSRTSVVVMTP